MQSVTAATAWLGIDARNRIRTAADPPVPCVMPIIQARSLVTSCYKELPLELGGAARTLAALGDRGLDVLKLLAEELSLPEPVLPWHTSRVRLAQLGSALAIAAGVAAKIGLDVQLLSQTEVAEVRERAGGASSGMPHKRNPVESTRARACARHAAVAASVLLGSLEQEHERAAGARHAEWKALRDALAYSGGAVAAARETLDGLEVDSERMRANITDDVLSEARRLGIDARTPDDYLGSANAFIGRALELYRNA
jgi:adenylosuccinate lyase